MRVVERAADFDAHVRTLFRLQRPRQAEQVGQGDALAELEGDVVDALLYAELVHRHDVRVAELDGGLRFLDETRHERIIRGQLGANLLHHQAFLEPDGPAQGGQIHPRHATGRDFAFEDILAEDLREHGCGA